ncbi:hypothetical protein DFO56_10459 [Kosakonia sp. AG348]|nr:hypothetical protein DFO56_10459 [Kosakonia sp. AG348]
MQLSSHNRVSCSLMTCALLPGFRNSLEKRHLSQCINRSENIGVCFRASQVTECLQYQWWVEKS